MPLVLRDAIKVALNSLTEGVIDKALATQIIEEAMNNNCSDCKEKVENDLIACLMTLEKAIDEEMQILINMNDKYPLDCLHPDEAIRLFEEKNMILHCEDGHILGMYREQKIINVSEVQDYGESKRVACL